MRTFASWHKYSYNSMRVCQFTADSFFFFSFYLQPCACVWDLALGIISTSPGGTPGTGLALHRKTRFKLREKVCFWIVILHIPSDCFVGMIPSSLAAAVTSSMLLKKMSTVKGAVQSESQCAMISIATAARYTTLREQNNISVKGLCRGAGTFETLITANLDVGVCLQIEEYEEFKKSFRIFPRLFFYSRSARSWGSPRSTWRWSPGSRCRPLGSTRRLQQIENMGFLGLNGQ